MGLIPMDTLNHVKLGGLPTMVVWGSPQYWDIYLIYPCNAVQSCRRINVCRSPITTASTSIASGGSAGDGDEGDRLFVFDTV